MDSRGEISFFGNEGVDIGNCYRLLGLKEIGNDNRVGTLVECYRAQELGEVEEGDCVVDEHVIDVDVNVEDDAAKLEALGEVGQRLALASGLVAHVERQRRQLDHERGAQQRVLGDVLVEDCVEVGCLPTLRTSNLSHAA